MPLTRRQFELGIDEESENWMRQVYELLASHRDLAYSSEELYLAVLDKSTDVAHREKFDHALYILAEVGGVDVRVVDDTRYFAFLEELDTMSWVKTVFRL